MLIKERPGMKGSEKTSPMENDHTTNPSPSFLPHFEIWVTQAHMLGVFVKPLGPRYDLCNQPCGIQPP